MKYTKLFAVFMMFALCLGMLGPGSATMAAQVPTISAEEIWLGQMAAQGSFTQDLQKVDVYCFTKEDAGQRVKIEKMAAARFEGKSAKDMFQVVPRPAECLTGVFY